MHAHSSDPVPNPIASPSRTPWSDESDEENVASVQNDIARAMLLVKLSTHIEHVVLSAPTPETGYHPHKSPELGMPDEELMVLVLAVV